MRFATKAIHSGEISLEKLKPVITPIFQTSNYLLDDEIYKAFLEGRGRDVWIYTRHGNPTRRAVEEKMAALEGGEDALMVSSGMGAVASVLFTYLRPGDHMVTSKHLYGGSLGLISMMEERFGIKVSYSLPDHPEGIIDAATSETKLFFFESISNPLLRPFLMDGVVEFARKRGIKIIVDNTFLSPYNFNPLQHGADLVIHSATKYLGGHSDLLAGVIVGSKEDIEMVWKTYVALGPTADPLSCFLLERSLKTLHVRMERHNLNALEVARVLEGHPKVEWVIYPMLDNYYEADYARSHFRAGGGMVTFKIKGGNEEGMRFMRKLKIIKEAASLGGVESLVSMPFNTSHYALSDEERRALGIEPGTIRLSVGIEDVEDILADIDQALEGGE